MKDWSNSWTQLFPKLNQHESNQKKQHIYAYFIFLLKLILQSIIINLRLPYFNLLLIRARVC